MWSVEDVALREEQELRDNCEGLHLKGTKIVYVFPPSFFLIFLNSK